MVAVTPQDHRQGMATIAIRAPRREELREAAELLARALGFGSRDAIPAWLMAVTDACGGITLVAVDGGRVVGISHAFPDLSTEQPGLYSCGLGVLPGYRRRGVARALKLEQRRRAQRAGYAAIRWTADPRNGAGLRLYLTGLGARLVAYHGDLHAGLRTVNGPQDDVEIVWPLGTPAALDGNLRWVRLGTAGELPRVRADMQELLGRGYVGVSAEAGEVPRVAFQRLA